MPEFTNLLVVMAVAFAAPLLLGLFPRVRLPAVVLAIVAGIVVGPFLLGIADLDQSVEVIALLGLAFVLFLAGLEIEFEKLRGPVLRLTGLGFVLSFAIAVAVSFGLQAAGLVDIPLLVAIILCATSLGVLVPVLSNLLMVPVFLAALLAARGLPASVYRRALDGRHTAIAGLMQATSLPFIVAATAIGMELELIDAAGSAALIGAVLLSVLLFPLGGLLLLGRGGGASEPEEPADSEPAPLMAMWVAVREHTGLYGHSWGAEAAGTARPVLGLGAMWRRGAP